MNDLAEFLLARIDEDEAGAHVEMVNVSTAEDYARGRIVVMPGRSKAQAARVLAECKAKWQIIGKAQRWIAADDGRAHQTSLRLAGEDILALLASVYSDHPDYREEWRP